VRIPEQKYAVFSHGDHISTIRRTINTIWNHWLAGVRSEGGRCAELRALRRGLRSTDRNGGFEIWVPIKE